MRRRKFLSKCVLGAAGLWIPRAFAQRSGPLDTAFWATVSGRGAGSVPTSDLQVWFKADGLGLNNNDVVATLTDFSGLGRNFTQATNSLRPLFKTLQQNSLPGVEFDGTDDFLSGNVASGVTAYSLYTVFKMKSVGGTQVHCRFALDSGLSASDGYAVLVSAGLRSVQHRVGGAATTMAGAAATTNFELWSVVCNATPSTALRVNRANQTVTNSTAAFTGTNNFGCIGKFGAIGFHANFVLGELILYKVAHSGPQRDAIELYLHNKWNV